MRLSGAEKMGGMKALIDSRVKKVKEMEARERQAEARKSAG